MAESKDRLGFLLLALSVLAADQVSKSAVAARLAVGETQRLLPGLFNLTHLHNRGAAFGLFSEIASPLGTLLLVAFSVAALTVVFVLLWQGRGGRLTGTALAFILGGILGNLVDRLRAGHVVDFLDFQLAGYHWPAFNLADCAIVVGAALLGYQLLCGRSALHPEA